MTFDEILEQIIALMKRQGRVSYSALRRRFEIDDAYLNDLKDELLFAYPVTDENDRGLVWTGETEASPVMASQPAQPESQPVIEQAQTTSVESSPASVPEAERRQLTVMFVDLVDSTRLSSELDPEIYREIVREYQRSCSEVIAKFDGNVAQLLGDGLLVYFGYPQAHEDDPQRSVRTGLGIIEAIGALNTRLEQDKGVKLAVRIGVHTGLVVVGEMGGEGRQEQLALGETPNIAARIQGLASPNTIVLSDATYRLIRGYFECESIGKQMLRGLSAPIAVYRVLRESGVQSRLEIAGARGLTPLIGRESECTLLFDRWEQAKEGNGQVVLLSGEAGIGKSRLVQVLKDHVANEPHTRMECRSSPYFTNSALYPITDFLQRMLRFQADNTPEQKLEKLEQNLNQYRLPLDETVPLFGSLISLPVPEDRYPALNLTAQRQRQKTLESIVAITLELAERQPVLFIVEDGHWWDASTNELLGLLMDQTPTAPLLLLVTCRPEFQPPWQHRSYLTEMTLNRLSRHQVEQVATQVAGGKALPAEVIAQLVDRTDGVPLYVEEMTKSVLESGVLKEADERYELTSSITSLSIPATLQDSLMARLDRLVTAKAVAQYASVIGRQFSYELLQAVSSLDEATLQRELGRLVEAELVYQRGLPPNAIYTFKHALVQDTAYESLLRNTRQGYHRRIAEVLEELFPETIESQPELLAHHFTEAGLNIQAVIYWQKAGQQASERSSYQEATNHLTTGLTLLQTLPETLQRHQQELTLQMALGAASLAIRGHAASEVEVAYTRARVLCQELGDTQDVFPALFGLWRFYNTRADFLVARQLSEELLALAERGDESSLYVIAHFAVGATLMWMGEPHQAHCHLEESIARGTPETCSPTIFRSGQDPGVTCLVHAAMALWLLGYPDQARMNVQDKLALSTELGHAFSHVLNLNFGSFVWQSRREARDVYDRATAAVTLSTEQGFSFLLAQSTCLRGWSLTTLGEGEEGVEQVRCGLMDWRAAGAELFVPYVLALLAEGYGILKQVEAGLDALQEGLKVMARTGERWYEAELHRLKGQLLLQQSPDNAAEAESCFRQAISIAQTQSAKSWELRASTSLARLWQSQGKRQEAHDLLAPVYGWFTEGFDTADLIDAKALLNELEGSQL